MNKEIIKTKKAPKAIGPYSQGIRVGDFVFLSGQIPLDPLTMTLVSGGIEEQTKQVLENIKAILEETSLSFASVIKTTIFLKNIADFGVVNKIYSKYFKELYPPRSTIGVSALPMGALIEIEVIAQDF